MNEPIEQNPPSTAETTDSQDRRVTFNRRPPTLAKAVLKVGSKSVVHAYTIHARPKNLTTPIHTEGAVIKSITE